MQTRFKKGAVYRNLKMTDIDFYVTNIELDNIVGYWVSRKNRILTHRDPDRMPFAIIKREDWVELND